MLGGKMVLSTSLLIAYENRERYQKKYKQLMQKFAPPYLTNYKQFLDAKKQGLEIADFERLLSQMANCPEANDNIEALANLSTYQVILTEDNNAQVPFVHYKKGLIDRIISIHLTPNDKRDELTRYIQQVCSKATKVIICDNYFAKNWNKNQALFQSILPRHPLVIEYVETPDNNISVIKNSEKITTAFVSGVYCDWTVQQSSKYQHYHDRYLKVFSPGRQIEIMLSSGFDHIWKDNPKEITCMFREIKTT